ncbi:hypothetical protein SAY87_002831 [Trapa incisa]|uniref:Uncharacterized protein n=1 Tax=Trapa incisa TaxID=236973 RepID=A0AAN7PV16_9MYRT|nr:hypothetical protein SAY87_002831 [Trapa incisa]
MKFAFSLHLVLFLTHPCSSLLHQEVMPSTRIVSRWLLSLDHLYTMILEGELVGWAYVCLMPVTKSWWKHRWSINGSRIGSGDDNKHSFTFILGRGFWRELNRIFSAHAEFLICCGMKPPYFSSFLALPQPEMLIYLFTRCGCWNLILGPYL